MPKLIRTDSTNPDFIMLVRQLDAYLAEKDGDEHTFYAQFNTLNVLHHVVVAYQDEIPVACGAFKQFSSDTVEMKRMFTSPEVRGKGFGSAVLTELELWATELSYTSSILETGKRQPEAVRLYTKNGYSVIPNFGQYTRMENSVCFKKMIQ